MKHVIASRMRLLHTAMIITSSHTGSMLSLLLELPPPLSAPEPADSFLVPLLLLAEEGPDCRFHETALEEARETE